MSSADEAAIRHVIDTYGERLRAADVEGVTALYTEDAAVMQPDQETAVGIKELTAAYEAGFAQVGMDFKFEVDDVVVDHDLAVVRSRTLGTVTIRASGETVAAAFRELFALRRVNGDWKIAEYMFQPMPGQSR